MQTNWVCQSEALRFCKNNSDSSLESLIATRVESFCEKRDSSRVTIFLKVTRVESGSPKIVTRVESLTRVTLSLPAPLPTLSMLVCRKMFVPHHQKLVNFERFNTILNSEILLNLIRKMKCLTDQFQLCFCLCIGKTK